MTTSHNFPQPVARIASGFNLYLPCLVPPGWVAVAPAAHQFVDQVGIVHI